MSIIVISKGSYNRGKEVAEKLAQKLGYKCISREVLIDASEQFNIPEIKLEKALYDAPSFLDRFSYGKDKYLTYIACAFLRQLAQDDIIYHGFGGHAFVQGVSHVLKVRVTADMEDRIKLVMERDNVPADKARDSIKKVDEERRKWNLFVTGIDPYDPTYYDMIFHIKTMTADDVADIISNAVKLPCFHTTPEAQKKINELLLAAEVKTAIVDQFPKAEVSSKDGSVFVSVKAPLEQQEKISTKVKELVKDIDGIKEVVVSAKAYIYWDTS